jgi:hypothetical protein
LATLAPAGSDITFEETTMHPIALKPIVDQHVAELLSNAAEQRLARQVRAARGDSRLQQLLWSFFRKLRADSRARATEDRVHTPITDDRIVVDV